MCSLAGDIEDDVGLKYLAASTLKLYGQKCNKCKQADPSIVLRNKGVYCKNCFLSGTLHKFKALLGKYRLIQPNSTVLASYEPGFPSAALLHFLKSSVNEHTPKKLLFGTVLLFIERNVHMNVQERRSILENIQRDIKRTGFEIYFISLLNYITNPKCSKLERDCCNIEVGDDDHRKLEKFVDVHKTRTIRNEFLRTYERKLLIDVAKKLSCKFIFTPELSVDLASQLLTDVSLGRGSHISLDIGFCDSRNPDVSILRPLKLFDIKELALYSYFNNVEPIVVMPKIESPFVSVQNLMQKFVNDLQMNYPATITTIMKTGDKLTFNDTISNALKCSICEGPIIEECSSLTSAESTKFSHWVSTQLPDNTIPQVDQYQHTLQSFENISSSTLCFTCEKIKF